MAEQQEPNPNPTSMPSDVTNELQDQLAALLSDASDDGEQTEANDDAATEQEANELLESGDMISVDELIAADEADNNPSIEEAVEDVRAITGEIGNDFASSLLASAKEAIRDVTDATEENNNTDDDAGQAVSEAGDQTTSPQTADATSSASAGAESNEDILGHDLADQIQELLDDANQPEQPSADLTQADEADTAAPQDVVDDDPTESSDASTDPRNEVQAQGEQTASDKPLPSTDASPAIASQEDATEDETDDDIVRQIDDLIAAEADDAVSGEFETLDDLLRAEEQETAEPALKDNVDTEATEQAHVEQDEAGPDPEVETVDASADIDTNEGAADDDELDAGDFSTVDQVADGQAVDDHAASAEPKQPQAAEGATAADVAAELDSQPESMPQPAQQPQLAAASEVADESSIAIENEAFDDAMPQPKWQLWLKRILIELRPTTLKQRWTVIEPRVIDVCEKLNRPLQRFSPEVRNAVGYVGLVTLFMASTVLFGKITGIL